jgi:hypothetical protein
LEAQSVKTFRLWKLVAVGLVLSLVAGTGEAQEKKDDAKTLALRAKAALALAGAKSPERPGFVNLAPVPREIPRPMPKAKCDCGEACKCPEGKCPAACPASREAPKVREPAKVQVGWRREQFCDGRQCWYAWVPVYEYR